MDIEARRNLQLGKPQDIRYSSQTYNIEDEIDRYILARVELRNRANENRAILKETDLEQAAYSAAEAAINKLLSDL